MGSASSFGGRWKKGRDASTIMVGTSFFWQEYANVLADHINEVPNAALINMYGFIHAVLYD